MIATDSASVYLTSGSNLYVNDGLVEFTNTDLKLYTGDILVNNGIISGSEIWGDGSHLINIPASGVTGLQLDRIVSGSVSASLEGGILNVNTDVVIDGTLTAKELHIDYVSSSVLYQSGSTKFGDTMDDVHEFTGSIKASGSVTIDGDLIVNGSTLLRSTDPNIDSLIVSGAMNIVQAYINSQIVSASLKVQGEKVIFRETAYGTNNTVIDLGNFE